MDIIFNVLYQPSKSALLLKLIVARNQELITYRIKALQKKRKFYFLIQTYQIKEELVKI